jgi:hypothetical protein
VANFLLFLLQIRKKKEKKCPKFSKLQIEGGGEKKNLITKFSNISPNWEKKKTTVLYSQIKAHHCSSPSSPTANDKTKPKNRFK